MIPAGVVRIIWAITPTPEFRDAMLGDFNEEYNATLRRGGHVSARAQCWREALLSLGGTLLRSVPGRDALMTIILPAVVWGFLVTACTSAALTLLLLPAVYRFVPVSHSTAWALGIGPMALCASALAGYEAARVGRRSPLWSALVLGLAIAAVSVRAIALVWFWPALMPLAPVMCVVGAVLQQAQLHRLAWGTVVQA
jgi:hypothetical protein